MTTPDRFGKFSDVDYNPSASQELEVSRQAQVVRPARGLANQRNRAQAMNMARSAGNAIDRNARGVGPAGPGSRLIGAAARGAMAAKDPRVRTAGAVVNRVVQAHDVAAANGIDIPGRAKDFIADVASRIRQRPPREHGFFTKLTNKFGNRAHSIPEIGENVGQYGERMMTAERDEREAARKDLIALEAGEPDRKGRVLEAGTVPGNELVQRYEGQLDTAGMDEFIDKSRRLGQALELEEGGKTPVIVEGEVVDVTEVYAGQARDQRENENEIIDAEIVEDEPEQAEQPEHCGRDIVLVKTSVELYGLEDDFDKLDAEHDFERTAGKGFEIVENTVQPSADERMQETIDRLTTEKEDVQKRVRAEERDAKFDEFKNNEFGSQEWTSYYTKDLNGAVTEPIINNAATGAAVGAASASQRARPYSAESTMVGSPSVEENVEAMRQASQQLQCEAAMKWAASDAKSNPFNAENLHKSTADARDQMRKNHDHFAGMMMMSAVAPLRKGLSAENLASVAGSIAIMWALSPKFRDYTDGIADKLMKGSQADAEHKAANEKKGFLRKTVEERARSAKKAAKYLFGAKSEAQRMQDSDPVHAPYQVDSAATQLVNMSDNAYTAMREPNANVEVILRKYGKLIEELEQDWETQGLEREDVYQRARWIVGQQSMEDPTVAGRYIDTHTGNVQMSDNQSRRVNTPNGWAQQNTWDGNWVAGENQNVVIGRSAKFFTPRAPQRMQGHALSAAESMTNVMRICMRGSMKDPARFKEFTTTMAVMTPQGGELGNNIDMINVAGSSNPAARGVQTMQSLRAAMRADGYGPEQIDAVMNAGMNQAMDNIKQQFPEQMRDYTARLQQMEGGENQTIDTVRQQQSALVLSNPDRYLAGAASTKTTAEPHMGQGQAAYQAYAREETQKAAEQVVQDAAKQEPTRIAHEQKQGRQSEQQQQGEQGSKSEKNSHSHAPTEDEQDVEFQSDEKSAPESESAMEQKYGKPGEGTGSRQRQEGAEMAKQARVDRQRRDEQRRRAVRNTVQRQNEADMGPEL